jgi:hypothetical protein
MCSCERKESVVSVNGLSNTASSFLVNFLLLSSKRKWRRVPRLKNGRFAFRSQLCPLVGYGVMNHTNFFTMRVWKIPASEAIMRSSHTIKF